ncbi:MAG: cardiolipin synthase [Bacteroidaceae bacterium]|nr:cardiolipin synthase [Bacteroidaceae bacterium]
MRRLLPIILILLGTAFAPYRLFAQSNALREALEANGVKFAAQNRMVLLTSGVEKFNDMFRAIRQARKYIHLEYFNFRNDSIGRALFTLLAEKAREGVEVRALFDAFGNDSNNRPLRKCHLDSMRSQGIDIREFDPIRFPYINHAYHRDHRKIVVIDGALAYSGGMNVADYYLVGRPDIGEWRDMHFRLEGPSVVFYEHIFATTWLKVTGKSIDYLTGIPYQSPADFKDLKPADCDNPMLVGVGDRYPKAGRAILRRSFETCLDSAKREVKIVSPYFVPTKRVWRALKRAVKRGVKVEIMVSVNGDVPLTPCIVAYRVNQLRKLGAHIYYYKGGFHHSKVMMMDGEYCTIGSTNLDARSLCYDYEVNAFVLDPCFTRRLNDIFEEDKANCYLLDDNNRRQIIPNRKLFIGRVANILTWVM